VSDAKPWDAQDLAVLQQWAIDADHLDHLRWFATLGAERVRHAAELAEAYATLRAADTQLFRAASRLGDYTFSCECPGELCVSHCAVCNKTQGIVNDANTQLRVTAILLKKVDR
jgi:hypothetical protein